MAILDPSKALLSRTPPHNLEAEASTLGSMLLSRPAVDRAAEIVSKADFYNPANQIIFDAILRLAERDDAIDPVTVCEQLKSTGQFEKVGGQEYILSLMDTVPTAGNVEYYAKIVEEKAILRRLIEASAEINSLGHDEDSDVAKLVDQAERIILEVAKRRLGNYFFELPPMLTEVYERMEAASTSDGLVTGVPTGFREIDDMTCGLQPGDLVIVAARPSMGKTALAMNMAVNAAMERNLPVAIFSLEMSKEQLVTRMICSQAMVDSNAIRRGFFGTDDFDRIHKACNSLMNAPLYIDDTTDITSMMMRAKCRRLRSDKGLQMVVVDYLQLVRWHRQTENRNQEITEIARSLKSLARELKVPVVALSQLSRMTERREGNKPMLSDLRESGSIEAEADVVMMIYREKYYEKRKFKSEDGKSAMNEEDVIERPKHSDNEEDIAEIIIAKQRNGPTGVAELAFIPRSATFKDLEKRRDDPGY